MRDQVLGGRNQEAGVRFSKLWPTLYFKDLIRPAITFEISVLLALGDAAFSFSR